MACFECGVEEVVVYVAPNSLRQSTVIAAASDRYSQREMGYRNNPRLNSIDSASSLMLERDGSAQPLTIKTNMSFREFLKLAGLSLAVRGAQRVFLSSGREIFTVHDLNQGSTVYISSGEPFFRQLSIDASAHDDPRGSPLGHGALNGHIEDDMQLNESRLFISVLGPQGCGKSALVQRLLKGRNLEFSEVPRFEPTIEDAYRKSLYVDNICDNVEVLDTGGQDEFRSYRQSWMSDKDAYIFVFSLEDRTSFEALDNFAQLHLAINGTRRRTPPLVLVGTKCEELGSETSSRGSSRGFTASPSFSRRGRAVSQEEALQKLEEWRTLFRGTDIAAAAIGTMHYFECSAKTGQNVDAAFHCAVREIRQQRRRHNEANRRRRDGGGSTSIPGRIAGGWFRCCS